MFPPATWSRTSGLLLVRESLCWQEGIRGEDAHIIWLYTLLLAAKSIHYQLQLWGKVCFCFS